jgi:hypothetical protein
MQKLKLISFPILIAIALLLLSWYQSYPVSMDSPNDFVYNHISYLYWLSLAILFASFLIVAMYTKNNSLRWIMAVGTFLLIFSLSYFYYMIPGSDSNEFRGLTEYFLSTGNLSSLNAHHYYYQWPLFFILNQMTLSVTGLNPRAMEFVIYGVIGCVITSFVYILISKVHANAYIAVTAFFIILYNFFDFQFWAPFTLSLCLILLLLYLDNLSGNRNVTLLMLIVFVGMVFTHILTPLFFVTYCLVMYIIRKNRRYLSLFILTSTIYALVFGFSALFTFFIKQLTVPFFGEFLYRISLSTQSPITLPPLIDAIAQLLSRTAVITTALVTGLSFIILLSKRKLRATDYAMFLTGVIFAVSLIASPAAYHELSNRSFFLLCIPASQGASFLCESKFRKHFRLVYLVLLVLFIFTLMHQTFYDREIFFQTKQEYQYANFIINTVNWTAPNTILSNFRLEQYLMARSSSGIVAFHDDSSTEFPGDITNSNYVAYDVGLATSLSAANYSIEGPFEVFDANHFDIVYSSGNFSYILEK